MYSLDFNFGWHRIQVWVLVVQESILIHCALSFSNRSKVLQRSWSTLGTISLWHSCNPLDSWTSVSQVPSWALLQRCPCFRAFGLLSLTVCYPPLQAVLRCPGPTVDLRVMWQVLAAACCLHPAKALFQLRVATTGGAWGREWEGGSVWKERKMWRSGQPICKATCGLLGLHLLFGAVLLDLWPVTDRIRCAAEL